jgi:hypothetical protein
MQVDISFDFAKVYNIEKVDIVVGQKFTLITDYDGGRYFSENDPVLSLKPIGRDVEGEANEVGTSTILIMDASFVILKTLTIQVVEAIAPLASTLGVTAGSAIQK